MLWGGAILYLLFGHWNFFETANERGKYGLQLSVMLETKTQCVKAKICTSTLKRDFPIS